MNKNINYIRNNLLQLSDSFEDSSNFQDKLLDTLSLILNYLEENEAKSKESQCKITYTHVDSHAEKNHPVQFANVEVKSVSETCLTNQNSLWSSIEKIASDKVPFTFDFTQYACDSDPLRHFFEIWKPYYNMKYHLCKSLEPKSILEIGVRYGYSAMAFLSASPDASYTGIDNDSTVSGGVPGAIEYARYALKDYNTELIIANTQIMDMFPAAEGNKIYDLIHVDGQQDGDGTCHDLELALRQGRYIWVDGYFWSRENLLAVTYFLQKYKMCIDYAVTIPGYAGEMIIKVKDGMFTKNAPDYHALSYADLPDDYNAYYYLNDCGGYDTFLRSGGKQLDPRLESMIALSGNVYGKNVLDIGCGRGELTNRFYELGANTVGVDYSHDAINIARSTFSENSRLKYLCEDVLKFSNEEKFDRVIMADVVEHIEQVSLNILIKKISALLSDDGILLIHTAPNKLYYDVHYAAHVDEIRRRGVYIPTNPRSYFEDLMHINEQTPESLKITLEQHFAYVEVWTVASQGSFLEWFGKDCPHDIICSHPEVYAVAACSENALFKFAEIINEVRNYKLERDDVNIDIRASSGEQIFINKDNSFAKVSICNKGTRAIRTNGEFPVNISYHIVDCDGNTVLHDGDRTKLIRDILPGETIEQDIIIRVDSDLITGDISYKAVITLVQEGMFWFDEVDKHFSYEIGLKHRL